MEINGSICALATPFVDATRIDEDALRRLVDYQIDQGTQALVVAGSTGEAHFLDDNEYAQALKLAIDQSRGRVPVVAGTGGADTRSTIEASKRAAQLGADAALVVAPYYVRAPQEGMLKHFIEVAEHTDLPIIAYNVPTRTGCDFLPETVLQLRQQPSVIAIKEAVSDGPRLLALAMLQTPEFTFLSGDDYSAAVAMLAGARGTISVVANIVPGPFRQLCDAACAGDQQATLKHMRALSPLLHALTCAPNPISVKAGLAMLGYGDGSVRLPLVPLQDQDNLARIHRCLTELVADQLAV